ncbi:MAG: hypothetical protein IJN82_01245 [Clostridia bacterium]|nr:hypothetical protein [Clostridia bacterium]
MITGYNNEYYEALNEVENLLNEVPSEMLGVIIAVLLGMLVLVVALAVLFYLFTAFGLYRMGKNRGMTNAYLAFIPVADVYYVGALSDQINAANGKQTNIRVKLFSFYLVYFGCNLISGLFQGFALATGMLQGAAFMSVFSLIVTAFSIVYTVFFYIALYAIYKEYSPNRAAAFLVLSILFSFTMPFFIFALRNKVGTSQQPKMYDPQQPIYPQQYQ